MVSSFLIQQLFGLYFVLLWRFYVFVDVTIAVQLLYCMLTSQRRQSYCSVAKRREP